MCEQAGDWRGVVVVDGVCVSSLAAALPSRAACVRARPCRVARRRRARAVCAAPWPRRRLQRARQGIGRRCARANGPERGGGGGDGWGGGGGDTTPTPPTSQLPPVPPDQKHRGGEVRAPTGRLRKAQKKPAVAPDGPSWALGCARGASESSMAVLLSRPRARFAPRDTLVPWCVSLRLSGSFAVGKSVTLLSLGEKEWREPRPERAGRVKRERGTPGCSLPLSLALSLRHYTHSVDAAPPAPNAGSLPLSHSNLLRPSVLRRDASVQRARTPARRSTRPPTQKVRHDGSHSPLGSRRSLSLAHARWVPRSERGRQCVDLIARASSASPGPGARLPALCARGRAAPCRESRKSPPPRLEGARTHSAPRRPPHPALTHTPGAPSSAPVSILFTRAAALLAASAR